MNVASPCNEVCRLDRRDVCVGCGRTRDEIARWTQMTDLEKAAVLARLGQRRLAARDENK